MRMVVIMMLLMAMIIDCFPSLSKQYLYVVHIMYLASTFCQKSGGSQWHQQNILDVSHQDPLRSSHLEPPEPPMTRNACFMVFPGSLWP